MIWLTSCGVPVATSFTIPPMAAPFWSVRPFVAYELHVPPALAPSNCTSANCETDANVRIWTPLLTTSGVKFDCAYALRPCQSTPMPKKP